jgi:hypothetical protein
MALVLALSGAGHLALLAWLLQQRPVLTQAVEAPAFEVIMAPRYLTPKAPPPRPQTARPAPLRLHRPVRPEESAVAPLPLPAPPATASDLQSAVLPHPGEAQLRNALRGGAPGCVGSAVVKLARDEQDRCAQRLGAGARDAAYLPPSIDRGKQKAWDAIAAKKAFVRGLNMPHGTTTEDITREKDIPWVLGPGDPGPGPH